MPFAPRSKGAWRHSFETKYINKSNTSRPRKGVNPLDPLFILMPIVSLLIPDTNLRAPLSLSNRTSMKKFLSNRIPHPGKKSASSLSPTTATGDSDKDKASIYSALSGDSNKKKRILDAFWDDSTPDESGNSKKLAKRYKKVIHSIDSLERKVWENLSGSMKGSEESEISILGNFIRTSKYDPLSTRVTYGTDYSTEHRIIKKYANSHTKLSIASS